MPLISGALQIKVFSPLKCFSFFSRAQTNICMTDATRRRLNLFSYLYLYSLKSSDKHLHDRHGKKTTELVVAKNCLGKLSRCHLMIKTGDFGFEQIQLRGKELLCRCHRVYVKNKIMSPALSYDNLSNAILNLWPTN